MNKIAFPLKPEMKGNAVRDLQKALQLLLSRGVLLANRDAAIRRRLLHQLREEVEKGVYGRGTTRIVRLLQQEFDLPRTGAVDPKMSDMLNALLGELGAFDRDGPGERRPDPDVRPDRRRSDPRRDEPGRTDGRRESRHREEVTERADPPSKVLVRGRVVGPDYAGRAGIELVLVDKNVGGDQLIGRSSSGKAGLYEIGGEIPESAKGLPDLQVRAVDGKTLLAASLVRYDAGELETGLDILIPADKLRDAPEYARITADIAKRLGTDGEAVIQEKLVGLREDSNQRDITYLANKTGWDARLVAMTALAGRFGAEDGIEPAFYYALFRSGVPANEAALARIPLETAQRLWKEAATAGILPEDLIDRIPEARERFRELADKRLLVAPGARGGSSLKAVLETVIQDERQQIEAVQVIRETAGDREALWSKLKERMPEQVEALHSAAQLAQLTAHNAPLMAKLRAQDGRPMAPAELLRQGYYSEKAWLNILDENVPLPEEIPGEDAAEQRANFAGFMAGQMRLSYPTGTIRELVRTEGMPVAAEAKPGVTEFLESQDGRFELGVHPLPHYLQSNELEIAAEVRTELAKLQRTYQMTPTDQAMAGLLGSGLDSARAVARYSEDGFVRAYAETLGGSDTARATYRKASQIHTVTTHLAVRYAVDRSTPLMAGMGDMTMWSSEQLSLQALPAQPTLEAIFGELDYCACDHCRSWLSPAAYLVDLFLFLDGPDDNGGDTPLDVLFQRRPDLLHLRLDCENTETVLPYIDLVNEILEHFVMNGSLDGFQGHQVDPDTTTADLLASPQFVADAAYDKLRQAHFPPPLPFHRPLEALRRHFTRFEVPLHTAMARVRPSDAVNRPDEVGDPAYGFRDIALERLGLSREEAQVLTTGLSLQALYGADPDTVSVETLLTALETTVGPDPRSVGLTNAALLSRRLGVSYTELADLVGTRFVNPNVCLLQQLERLPVSFARIKALVDNTISDSDFDAALLEALGVGALSDALDPAAFGGDVKKWLHDHADRIMGLIVLVDPSEDPDPCNFDRVELRYAEPDMRANQLRRFEFVRLVRFVRLWRKLGWSIDATDRALAALYPAGQVPADDDTDTTARAKLDAGFAAVLVRLSHLLAARDALGLSGSKELQEVLACWAPIDAHGPDSLYRRMFRASVQGPLPTVFLDDGYGAVLADRVEFRDPAVAKPTVLGHAQTLRGAFNLTRLEFDQIVEALGIDATTVLDLETLSQVFRRGYLARRLRISVRELLALQALADLDPFAPLDFVVPVNPANPIGAVRPPALRLIELVAELRGSPFKIAQLLFYLQHLDFGGQAAPEAADVRALARGMRADLVRIAQENAVVDDPTGEITHRRLAQTYGQGAADTFFSFVNATARHTVAYSHPVTALEESLRSVTAQLSYDDFRKQLTFDGVMTAAQKAALDGAAAATADFRDAMQQLYDAGAAAVAAFAARYPEIGLLYAQYLGGTLSYDDLLGQVMQVLVDPLQRQQVRQSLSAQLDADLALVTPLLEQPAVLHAAETPGAEAIWDFLALAEGGLTLDVHFADTLAGVPDRTGLQAAAVTYDADAPLPADPANPAAPMSGVWRGLLEAPDTGFYKFRVSTDVGASVQLEIGGQAVTMVAVDGVWRNEDAVELAAGTLYTVRLSVERVRDGLGLAWETRGRGREPIPSAYLYPAAAMTAYHTTYLRMLKALAIADTLALDAGEVAHFAARAENAVAGEGWLNALPTGEAGPGAVSRTLLDRVRELIGYRRMRTELSADAADRRLLAVLKDPAAVGPDGTAILSRLTGWQTDDRDALLARFGHARADLAEVSVLARVTSAWELAQTLQVDAATLLDVTTNAPTADTVRMLEGALRARYDEPAWREVAQEINDDLRTLQRDALIAYVLHDLRGDPVLAHIDTAEKLFEFFLIDVKMDACMRTSRIKQAISSTQLFVQRCLMNLESGVVAGALSAETWRWMKRYRLWEANRKVFLWPENWLEPELRDNKSPLFETLESELLETDITEDAAATALAGYLEGLDRIAKLEVTGLAVEEGRTHVIGRSGGAERSYYYRRQDSGVSWRPWRAIDVEIEGDPAIPVVWQGRLFVFWLKVLVEPLDSPEVFGGGSDSISEASLDELLNLGGDTKMIVTGMLCWSEHYNGKWQPQRTSDPDRPLRLGWFETRGANAFARENLSLRAVGEDDFLEISTYHASDRKGAFRLYNTHSSPEIVQAFTQALIFQNARRAFQINDDLTISYNSISAYNHDGSWTAEHQVLRRFDDGEVVAPAHRARADSPFFAQDRAHCLYVTTTIQFAHVTEPSSFVEIPEREREYEMDPVIPHPDIPPREIDPRDLIDPPGVVPGGPMPGLGPLINPGVDRFQGGTVAPQINRVMDSQMTVTFDDQTIHAQGGVMNTTRRR